ncbi:MarP family serine protease [Corynebacterium sp. A21]|uniref:MarP family serine protease n=1 Tax=Corynebacterium sp. A21 TaxID=3457318 RepID=UPI003FD222A6
MTVSLIIDAVLILAVVVALISGWRAGAFSSVLSTVGVVAGLICGAALAPVVMQLTDSTALRVLLALGTIILLIGIGNLVGGMLGSALRDRMRFRSSMKIDSGIGAIFQGVVTLFVAWLVAIPLATGVGGAIGEGMRDSVVLGFVDSATPNQFDRVPTQISALLNDSGIPQIGSPFQTDSSPEVEAPRINVANHELVESLRPSVIHVLGDAQVCSRRLMGSGFVTESDYVITNAHVVAGTETIRLDTVLGVREAEVVYYNPEVDIAVLHSPGLDLPVLPWATTPAATGDDAMVMGFPESSPFEAAPARIRDQITIAGPDIYANGRVEREAYTVRGSIRQGNSGGPMTNTEGDVLGVVFGASVDSSDTGYALTAAEVQRQLGDVTRLTEPVDTESCVAR